MTELIYDTYALIEIIENNPNYTIYGESKIHTTEFNLIEFLYWMIKDYGEKTAKDLFYKFRRSIVKIDDGVFFEAARIRIKHNKLRLSYADCIGYAYALKHGMKFLTGDKAFKNMKNVEFVK